MDTAELVEKIDSRADKEAVNSIDIRLKSVEERMAEALDSVIKPADSEAEMERGGVLDQVMDFKFWSVPLGQAVAGGFVAIVTSELVDGFMKNQQPWQRGLVKLGVAGAVYRWGGRLLGTAGKTAVTLLLAFDGIRDLTPIDSWADQLAEKITGTVTTGGLAGAQSGGAPTNVNTGGGRSSGQSFYSQALGG